MKTHLATKLIEAAEILASSHLLEKLDEPLKACYASLRSYSGCSVNIADKENCLKISFTENNPKLRTSSEYAVCAVTCIKSGKLRVSGTSDKYGDINKLCPKPRDVRAALDSWLDR